MRVLLVAAPVVAVGVPLLECRRPHATCVVDGVRGAVESPRDGAVESLCNPLNPLSTDFSALACLHAQSRSSPFLFDFQKVETVQA